MKLSTRTRRKVKISLVPKCLQISLQEAQWEGRGDVAVKCWMTMT